MKKKILSLLLALCLVMALVPMTAFAANETVGTLAALQTAITNAAGTEENPTVIVISGQIEVNRTIEIPAGKYIKLVGENSNAGLIRADSFTFANSPVTNSSHLLSVQGGLVLEDITIDGNNKSGGSLVFIYGNNAFAVMNEGTTLKNNLNGAVNLYSQNSTKGNPCHFIMNGGTICNNSASQGAGVAIINYGYADFTMSGGVIKENTATSTGGGAIYSGANGTVTISSGEIIDNKSTGSEGGAMYVTGRSALVITGGEISGNQITTSKRGGGIYKSGNAAFTMTGGVIKDNSTAKNDGREGQDIYIASGDFNLGGTAQIPDGLFIERYNNSSDRVKFYITSPLQNNIGIEGLWTSPSEGRVVAVGKDYTITQSDFEKISYNHASLVLKFDKDNNQIVLGKPSYTVAYTLSDMTFDGPEDIEKGNSLTTTLNPSVGYHSPSSITVKINGVELDKMNYQAVPVQGGIGVYIPAEYVTGNVEISAKAEAHFGGTATCTALAVCTGCGQSYGSVNPDNHTGAVVWVQTETTHKKVYNCCQTEVSAEESHNWENGKCTVCGYPCSHTGGTATCSQLAICTICGSQYGELDPDNHKPVSEWTQENGKHYHKCEYGCDTHLDETNCFGGEATCTEKAVCEICFNPYGEINASNHTNLVKTEAKAATHLETGNKEYWYCDGCNKYFSDEAGTKEITLESTVIPKLTEHTFDKEVQDEKYLASAATCCQPTKYYKSCECGESSKGTEKEVTFSVGNADPSNHTNLVKTEAKPASHLETGNKEYWYCDGCNKYFSDEAGTNEITLESTVIPKLTEHTADDTGWHSDETNHWNICECGEVINKEAHKFSDWTITKEATKTEAGSRTKSCTVCGYKVTESIPATGTTEPTNPPKPTDPDKKNPDTGTTSPQTGDNSNFALWIALLFISGGAAIGTTVVSRKKKYNR